MEKVKSVLERRLEVVRRRKEAVLREEARLIRLARQKRDVAMVLAKVKKEKLALMAEEAKVLRRSSRALLRSDFQHFLSIINSRSGQKVEEKVEDFRRRLSCPRGSFSVSSLCWPATRRLSRRPASGGHRLSSPSSGLSERWRRAARLSVFQSG